ncbi:hypothetical protein L6R52_21090 [Myxococcota bacterium]|nr:hypothetical protein [Myxococcota bacterium]
MSAALGVGGLVARVAWRAPLRLVATLVALTIASYGLALAALGRASIDHATSVGMARLGADLLVVPKGTEVPLQQGLVGGLPMEIHLEAGVLEDIQDIPGIQVAAPQWFLASSAESCCESGRLLLIGFDPARDLTILPWVGGASAEQHGNPLWVGAAVFRGPGEKLRLYDVVFDVQAKLDETGIGYFDNAAFVPMSGVRRMEAQGTAGAAAKLTVAWDRPSAILLRLAERANAAEVVARIEAARPSVEVVAPAEIIDERRSRIQGLLAVAPTIVFFVALIATAIAVAAQVSYWSGRRASLGLLVALGARRGALLGVYALEALALGLGGAVLGVAGALGTITLFAQWARIVLGLPMLPTAAPLGAGTFALALAAPIVLVVAGAVLAVGAKLRQDPYLLIRRER